MSALNPIVDSDLILHRGASAYAPENTIEAVHLAADMGATWLETDVRITADNQLVMIHDDNVRRTTNGAGRVALMKLADIQELDAGSWFSDEFTGVRIPRLANYLAAIQTRDLGLILELKDEPGWEEKLATHVADIVKDVWTADPQKLVISGFSERCLKTAKMLLPDFPQCHAISAVPDDPVKRLAESGADMLHIQHKFGNDDTLARLRETGMEFACATINDHDLARHLLDQGATSVLTDKPDLFCALKSARQV